MSINFNEINKDRQTVEWARLVRRTFKPENGWQLRIVEKIGSPGVNSAQRLGNHRTERPISVAELVNNFAKGMLPVKPSERQEVADTLVVLKQRIKTHYYAGNWGSCRWILALFFSCVRFENTQIGRRICYLESLLDSAENLNTHEKELRDYIHKRGIPLPNGRASSVEELEESLRVHWLTLSYEEIIHENKYLPKTECCNQFMRIALQTVKRHYSSLDLENMMVVESTPLFRNTYLEALQEKLSISRENLQIKATNDCKKMVLNPYFMVGVASYLEKSEKPLQEVSLCGPIDDAAIVLLTPQLGKIDSLQLGNKITKRGAQQLLEHVKGLYKRGAPAPHNIDFFLSGHDVLSGGDIVKRSVPLTTHESYTIWANLAGQGERLIVNFEPTKRYETPSVKAEEPLISVYASMPEIPKLPMTKVGKTLDLTEVKEEYKGVIWAQFLNKALHNDEGSMIASNKKHLYVFNNNLRPEEFILSIHGAATPGFTRLTCRDIVDLSVRLCGQGRDIETYVPRKHLRSLLHTRYYAGILGQGRKFLERFISRIRFENTAAGRL